MFLIMLFLIFYFIFIDFLDASSSAQETPTKSPEVSTCNLAVVANPVPMKKAGGSCLTPVLAPEPVMVNSTGANWEKG